MRSYQLQVEGKLHRLNVLREPATPLSWQKRLRRSDTEQRFGLILPIVRA